MLKTIFVGSALIVASCVSASALPLVPSQTDAQPRIVLVSGGCGLAFHRDPYGVCVPNRRYYGVGPVVVAPGRLPPPCPRGYHRDPDPARPICYPNF